MKNTVKKLNRLVIGADGCGQGLMSVNANEVTLAKIKNIIGKKSFVRPYPFKMVYKGKKYWMICDENGIYNYESPSQFEFFTCGMMNVEFEYTNGKKAHIEDLKFNGILPVNFGGPNAIVRHYGPIVFIEDIGNNEIFSDYWEYEECEA